MNVISRKKLEAFWQKYPDSMTPLKSWYNTCRKARWKTLDEVQVIYPHADPVGDCTVFNIGGNKYRLIVKIRYPHQRIYVIYVLTHKDYDKESGKMIVKTQGAARLRRFNKQKYGKLLAESAPTVIRTEAQYDRAIAEIEKLLKKGDGISAEEEHLLDLLSTLVEQYEDKNYPIEMSAPHEILQHLMEARSLKQKDIVHLFGSSGRASEAINGRRPISKLQARSLAEFFHVSTDLFLSV